MKKLLGTVLSLVMTVGLASNVTVNAADFTKKEEVKEENYVVCDVEEKPVITYVNILFPQPVPGKTPKEVYFSTETEPLNAINNDELKSIDISDYWYVSVDGKTYSRMNPKEKFGLGKYYKLDPMDLMDVALDLFTNMGQYINTEVVSGLDNNFSVAVNDVPIDMKAGMGQLFVAVSSALDYGVCTAKVNNIEATIATPVDGEKQISEVKLVGEDSDKIELAKESKLIWIDEATGKEMAADEKYVAGKRYTAKFNVSLKEFCVYSDNVIATVNKDNSELVKVDEKTYTVKYTCYIEAPSVVKDATRKDDSSNKKLTDVNANNAVLADKSFTYVVTKVATAKKAGEVKVTGLVKKNVKKANIKATVKINGFKYKVTAIGDKAFKGAKKLKTVVIGKNVKTIGAKAFANLKKLTKVTIKAKKLPKIGKNAFVKKGKKVTIKVNSKLKKSAKKALKKAKCKGIIVK
ncbi:leucine-rich repeat protein [Eubacterium sp.]|uniref:leucine-rich repeat protein n=1 Tax=Eubacterium sp. TaxID=142586 RepID=UPI0025CE8012|nr:leucine-rich repeat protein [Eubacterium sp.]MCR5629562.1 leucine-rich repeat domain-containing protein [Eubacterium sp.]